MRATGWKLIIVDNWKVVWYNVHGLTVRSDFVNRKSDLLFGEARYVVFNGLAIYQ